MYIAMSVGRKLERVNIRIHSDVKVDGWTLAEMENRTLSGFIESFIVDRARMARKEHLEDFNDAAKRAEEKQEAKRQAKLLLKRKTAEAAKAARLPVGKSNRDERTGKTGIQKDSRTRAVGGRNKR
ncbi:MAG TPA: hypothetical protein VIX17_11670 [Pyrinomonadaceae bacterium]|jgi:hypothetical protein